MSMGLFLDFVDSARTINEFFTHPNTSVEIFEEKAIHALTIRIVIVISFPFCLKTTSAR